MNPPDSWKHLLQTLQVERTAYTSLSTLRSEEYHLLRKMDHQGLPNLTERKEALLVDLQSLEQGRNTLVNELIGGHHHSNPSEWLKLLSQGPLPWGKRSATELGRVLIIAREVAEQGRRNAGLVYRGLAMVREALRLIYSGGSREPVYGKSCHLNLPQVTSSLSIRG